MMSPTEIVVFVERRKIEVRERNELLDVYRGKENDS